MAGTAMLIEAGLSFLGLGVQPPDASWGSMLGAASRFTSRAPTLILFPGLAIAITVLAFNLIGDGLRDALRRDRSDSLRCWMNGAKPPQGRLPVRSWRWPTFPCRSAPPPGGGTST